VGIAAVEGNGMSSPARKRSKRTFTREQEFEFALRSARIGGWVREHRFHPTRNWRFDFAWPHTRVLGTDGFRLAVEIEGVTSFGRRKQACRKCGHENPGAFILGRHQTADGLNADCEKYQEALRHRWLVLRITQQMLGRTDTLDVIRGLVGDGGAMPARQGALEFDDPERPF
jgi:hypothetical protein